MNTARIALRAAAVVFGRTPRIGYWLAPLVGWVAWRVNTRMRRLILLNQVVLCDGDRERAKRNTRFIFTGIARYYVDLASIRFLDLRRLEERTISFKNEERLAILNEGLPIIALSAHFGSPELGVQAFIGRGRTFVALVEPLEPSWLAEELNLMRSAGGGRYLTAGSAGLRACLEELRKGGIVTLVGDRDIQGTGRCVTLLDRRVRLPVGPIQLAQRTGAKILPVLTTREPGDRLVLHVEEPFEVGPGEGALAAATERWAGVLEQHLRARPDQWNVAEDYFRVHGCG